MNIHRNAMNTWESTPQEPQTEVQFIGG